MATVAELTPAHREFLAAHAVDPDLAERLGVRSIVDQADAADLPAPWPNFTRVPYLAFPWTSPSGRTEWQMKPDEPGLATGAAPRSTCSGPRRWATSRSCGRSARWRNAKKLDRDNDGVACDNPPAGFEPAQQTETGTKVQAGGPAELPKTGTGAELGIGGGVLLALGVAAVLLVRRRRMRFAA